ncbi:MAG: hypothetical protein WC661_16910 [Opitutaceae bacterium]|jgi:hypothetical protein
MPLALFSPVLSSCWRAPWATVTAGVALFLSTLNFPLAPGAGLDETWQLLLSQAQLHGWRLGKDVIFTYGPLGALENNVQLPALYWDQVLWQIFSRAAAALLITRLALRLPGFLGLGGLGLAPLLYAAHQGSNPVDPYLLFAVLAAGFTLLEPSPGRAWRGLALAVLTTFALLKFTLFVAAGFAVIVVMLEQVRRRKPLAALATVGVFAAGYLILWRLLGHQWGDLPGCLRWSYEMADGYIDAMQLRCSWGMLLAATLLTTMTVGLSLLATCVRKPARETWAALLLTTGCLYLAWRHGTVRGDASHLPGLFCATAIWPVFLLAQGHAKSARLTLVALGLAVVSIGGLVRTDVLWVKVCDLSQNLEGNVTKLIRPWHAHALWLNEANQALGRLEKQADSLHWPAGTTVGAYGLDYAALSIHPDLKPLPNLQSYSAYTPALAGRDYDAFLREKPDFMFVDLTTIDNRLAGGENLPLLTRLLQNYRWEKTIGHFVLLRRNARAAEKTHEKNEPLQVMESVRFGQTLPIDIPGNAPVQMEAELTLTKLGRLVRIFYALPSVKLNVVTDEAWEPVPFRITWRLAGEGVALHPFLTSNADLENWMRRGQSAKVKTVSFDAVAARWLYREPFKVTLRPLPVPVVADSP